MLLLFGRIALTLYGQHETLKDGYPEADKEFMVLAPGATLPLTGEALATPFEPAADGFAPRVRRIWPAAVAVFLAVFVSLWWCQANRLVLNTNDEGIVLDAAARMLRGERLYVDFYGYMSPGSYWAQLAAFQLLGVTVEAARVPVIAYLALLCALVFATVARWTSLPWGGVVTLFFFIVQTLDLSALTPQHRWDSAAFSLAAIVCVIEGRRRGRWGWFAAGGLLAAAATLCTPSLGLFAVATALWLFAWRCTRRFSLVYAGSGAAVAVCAAGTLAAHGSWGGFVNQMTWLSRNYSDVNLMPYGGIIGGYGALLSGANIAETFAGFWVVFAIAIPALLPILGILSALPLLRKDRKSPQSWTLLYLILCTLCLVASAYPRPDVPHLAFVAAAPCILAAIAGQRLLSSNLRATALLWVLLWAVPIWGYQASRMAKQVELVTPVGHLHADPKDRAAVAALLENVRPGDGLYVHPYKPLFYFLTQAVNPTAFSYIQPGMMTATEENSILGSLRAKPPKWVLFLDVPLAEYLRVFPSGDPSRLRYVEIERWIRDHYEPLPVPLNVTGYALLQRKN